MIQTLRDNLLNHVSNSCVKFDLIMYKGMRQIYQCFNSTTPECSRVGDDPNVVLDNVRQDRKPLLEYIHTRLQLLKVMYTRLHFFLHYIGVPVPSVKLYDETTQP
jgi:hypothetical protein